MVTHFDLSPLIWIFLEVIILLGLAFFIAKKQKSLMSLWTQIHILVLISVALFGNIFLLFICIFSRLYSYPLYSCWIKPKNQLFWRSFGFISMFTSVMSSKIIVFKFIDMNGSVLNIICLSIFIPLIITLPVATLSFLDAYKKRNAFLTSKS